ncbi:hypothetical protein [Mycobacterium sp. AZCC_0083]|uniref:hypothetical protein n=1 Tax=Mycobacterium sp. AZCC_0083 TaxID=2735882 RepID=UPI00161B085A|nr:hypothetical protein [Mycobacterium sp. AZCC_0083]MBB5166931.1 hypothetical protein [Mycobacterium sp. AZCC_0083]
MTLPPPQDPYGPPPQVGGAPSWGAQAAGYGGQYGLPPQGPPGGPPQWGQQPQWMGPPGPPPGKGGRGKWILGGLAVLVVVVLAVVITVLVMRPSGSGGPTPTPTNANSDFASANDTGPVNIIAEDPTCEAWGRIGREYAGKLAAVNWAGADKSVPASAWTPDLRTMYETASTAMSQAADQTVNLAKKTPHRVMRELYEQFIAYTHMFVDKIPSYVASDENFSVVTDAIGNGLNSICSAISYGSAPPLAPLIADPAPPSNLPPLGDPATPTVLLTSVNSICAEWASEVSKIDDKTKAWRSIDPQIPATEWTPDQRAVNDAVASVMSSNSDELEKMGRQSGNSTLEDIAILAAQYQRAFVKTVPTYTPADNFLSVATTFLVKAIDWSCKAAE